MGEPRRGVSIWLWLLIGVGALPLLSFVPIFHFPDLHVRVVNASGRDLSAVVIVFHTVRSAPTRVERPVFAAGDSVGVRGKDGGCRVEVQWFEGEDLRMASREVDALPGDRWRIEIRPDGTLHAETE